MNHVSLHERRDPLLDNRGFRSAEAVETQLPYFWLRRPEAFGSVIPLLLYERRIRPLKAKAGGMKAGSLRFMRPLLLLLPMNRKLWPSLPNGLKSG